MTQAMERAHKRNAWQKELNESGENAQSNSWKDRDKCDKPKLLCQIYIQRYQHKSVHILSSPVAKHAATKAIMSNNKNNNDDIFIFRY